MREQLEREVDRPANFWPEVPWSDLTYEEASRHLGRYEEDFQRFETQNANKLEDWWDDAKLKVQRQLKDLRGRMDEFKDKSPDAWAEFRAGFAAAMHDLSEGYRKAIRELRT